MKKRILFSFFWLFGHLSNAQLPLLQTKHTYIVKSTTQEKIVLKGIGVSNNSWGFYEWPISDSLEKAHVSPMIRPKEMKPFVFTSEDVDRLAQLDANVIRYCFNHDLFHPENPRRASNMMVLRDHISQIAQKGKYTIVCMQYCPGMDAHIETFERNKLPQQRIKSVFESDSVFILWRDIWQYVANELKDMNAVAGFELISEPKRPALSDASEEKLIKCYVEVIDSIRSVDNRHIVMVPEFNSKEANPGEEYWSEKTGGMALDEGEQGTIWGRNWLALPGDIPNLVYVAHIYDPYEFTTGRASSYFDISDLQNIVKKSAAWAYDRDKPLYVSEYGANYHSVINGNDHLRIEYLKNIHDAFEKDHISTTIWQYKDLITPWVRMDETFGVWQHYYDMSTIKKVSNGKVEYSDTQAEQAAINSLIDPVLNEYFIEDGKFKKVSAIGNQSLINELNRYYNSIALSIEESNLLNKPKTYADKENLYFKNLPFSLSLIPVTIYDLNGKELLKKVLSLNAGTAQTSINSFSRQIKTVIVKYGSGEEWTEKIILP